MTDSLVPRALLQKSDKILFIAHLALGDYAYLQNCFRAFAEAYPHLKIHLWVDEVRRTRRPEQWESLKKYSLYDWLATSPYFAKVYNRTYSPDSFRQSFQEAREENYPIVVSLAVLRRHFYAKMARGISPHGFVVGQRKRVRLLDIRKRLIYRKLDASIPAYVNQGSEVRHISAIYADWFTQLFGVHIPETERFPFVHMPEQWREYASRQLQDWGFVSSGSPTAKQKIYFLNAFSKSPERTWPLERLINLIRSMRSHEAWHDACFIVNAVPEELERVRALLAGSKLDRVALFSAEESFFQLPAILQQCDLIISVETAVMHLANAVGVPVVALMRQKNPEWVPIDQANSTIITVSGRDDWVSAIGVAEVIEVLQDLETSLRVPA
jgi:ADP-heptose:LPS heptosyltransferase